MKYSKKKMFGKGTMVVMLILVIGMVLLNACWAEEQAWDVCYEMANRNVEWTYAGR